MNRMTNLALSGTLMAASSLGFVACAHNQPEALSEAQKQYQIASQGPAAKYAPSDLENAKEALNDAEKSFHDNGKSQQSYDLAYIADRRARLATTKAGIAMAEEQNRAATNDASALRDQVNAAQRAQLAAAQAASADANRRAQDAELALQRAGAVRETERGKVITLQGNVLFKTGQSDLLPGAKESLNQVAAVLINQPDRQLTIEGYTDSRGSSAMNARLSERRAQSVRDYLVTQGVNSSQLVAQGKGAESPIADNSTAEGRAMNRRVEIVVGNTPSTMGASRQWDNGASNTQMNSTNQ